MPAHANFVVLKNGNLMATNMLEKRILNIMAEKRRKIITTKIRLIIYHDTEY